MKKIAVILLTFVVAVPLFAQGRFGKDSAECVKYLSYYSEYVKQNNLDAAAEPWRQAFAICPPSCNQNLLINGAKILRNEFKKNVKDPVRREQILDSLLMIHDIRAQHYPKYAASSLNNKALDVINYIQNNPELQYSLLTSILENITVNGSPVVYVKQMQSAVDMYKAGKLSADELMNNFTTVSGYLESIVSQGQKPEFESAKQDVEKVLAESGVASCDNLVALFTPKYESNPTDESSLNSMLILLSKSECMNTELYLRVVESLNEVKPSASSAYFLYKLYSSKDENFRAVDALERAISLLDPSETNTLADYYLELASYNFKKAGRPGDAVSAAKKAIELNQNLAGKGYLLIGTIWGAQRCGGNEVESRANYWVAVDYMNRARNADPSLAEEAGSLAAQYSRYFPKQEDAFMYDVTDGSSFVAGCGSLRESTIVRTIK